MSTGALKRQSQSALKSSRKPFEAVTTKPALVGIQVECFYGIEESNGENAPISSPVLTRYIQGRVVLPAGVPLQNAARVIAMVKGYRKIQPTSRTGTPAPLVETVYLKFNRVWPEWSEPSGEPNSPILAQNTSALVLHDSQSALDFTIILPHDLPQSIAITGGAVYYTVQIQTNLLKASRSSKEDVLYSQEVSFEVPPPQSAYCLSKLPMRVTNGVIGQAQDHYGILISPDISLHVSVPREIAYTRRMHSVFKIHIKLMPHPPEAKLPGISRLEWRLTQKTNLGSVQLDRSSSPKRIGISTSELASGQVIMPPAKDGSFEAMSGGRKDQYLYIALPENSKALLPMYDGNKYLEILHQLEIELFLAAATAPSAAPKSNGFSWSAPSFFNKKFLRRKDVRPTQYKAQVPIRLLFEPMEVDQSGTLDQQSLQKLSIKAPGS